MLERLQKIIARAGIASRRHAETLITSGLVTVNGKTITELGSKADETKDHIKVSGKLLRPETERVYLILNKPAEVVSTMSDPEGRKALSDLLHGVSQRVFPVGRLEYHSMGVVFLTNDGDLANSILKSHHLPQTYNMKLKTLLTFEEIEALSQLTGARISRIKGKDAPWYEVTISDARRDALRNRLFQTGHPVEKIKRIKIGNLAMESLPQGHHRPLSDAEVATLRKSLLPENDVAKPFVPKPAAAQPESAGDDAARPASTPSSVATMKPAFAAGGPERKPLFKRVYRPKPKPGEQPRRFPQRSDQPNVQPGAHGDVQGESELDFNVPAPGERTPIAPPRAYGRGAAQFEKSQQFASGGIATRAGGGSFRPAPGGGPKKFRGGKPTFQKREGQGFGGFVSGKPERPIDKPRSFDRPRSFDKPKTFGGKPSFDKPRFGAGAPSTSFDGPQGDRPHKTFGGPSGASSGGRTDRPGKPYPKSFGTRPERPNRNFNQPPSGKPQGDWSFRNSAPGRPPRPGTLSSDAGNGAPSATTPGRPPFSKVKRFGSDRPFRRENSFSGDRPSGGSWNKGKPQEPGAFGRGNKTGGFKKPGGFVKGGKAGGPRGPKRSGPGGPSTGRPFRPKPSDVRGPRDGR
jgi:23S rRNA pseudouridine2605 synthase